MIRSTGRNHFASASSSLPVIWTESLLYTQNVMSFNFIFRNRKKITGASDLVSGGMTHVQWSQKLSKATAQRMKCRRECCHGAGPRSCCATCLDICTRGVPSAASEQQQEFPFTVCPGGINSWCFIFVGCILLHYLYMLYKHITKKTIHVIRKCNLITSLLFQKFHYMFRPLRAIFRWYFLRFLTLLRYIHHLYKWGYLLLLNLIHC
jgi:hypothetical protein